MSNILIIPMYILDIYIHKSLSQKDASKNWRVLCCVRNNAAGRASMVVNISHSVWNVFWILARIAKFLNPGAGDVPTQATDKALSVISAANKKGQSRNIKGIPSLLFSLHD